MIKRIAIILFFASLIGIFSIGCSRLYVKEFAPDESVILEEDTSLIFGKIVIVLNGEIKEDVKNHFLTFIHTESEKKGYWAVEKDGSFYCILKKGRYIIYSILWSRCGIQPFIKFEVPSERGEAFYIGTLKIDIQTNTSLPVHHCKEELNSIEILDEFNEAKEVIMNRNPDFTFKVEKDLMAILPDEPPYIYGHSLILHSPHLPDDIFYIGSPPY